MSVDAVYIHIPFCISKCNYCDFLSFSSTKEKRKKYVDYLIKEIELYPKYTYDTIYFGGGTPSLLDCEDIERILDKFDKKSGVEITLEVNPKTVTLEKLKKLYEIGVNRLSIGTQTFNDRYLEILGRGHSSSDAINTYEMARIAGFKNISLDLMFSLPNQKINEVLEDLTKLLELRPEHFSIYSLIWEEGTNFFKKLEKGIFKETENEIEAEMFEKIIDLSSKNGYNHYEISNFSIPNYESKHNSKYWRNKRYLGVGLGASGYIDNIRYKNQVQFSKYYDKIENGEFPILEKEKLTLADEEQYKYMLGFRLLKEGVVADGKYLEKCIYLEKKGFLKSDGRKYTLTHKGIMYANDVIENFLE